jgi:4-hydroxybutyrate CoA-transferase
VDWKTRFKDKVLSPEEAIRRVVRPGDIIGGAMTCGFPQVLPEAIVRLAEELSGITIMHGIVVGNAPHYAPHLSKHIKLRNIFVFDATREAVKEGRAEYVPMYFYEMPECWRKGIWKTDVTMMQVSPPDVDGYMSLGVTVGYTPAMMEVSRAVLAEVNPNMPRTHGETLIHVSQVDYLVEGDRPVPTIPRSEPDEVSQAIGRHVAELIEDGSTLQIGIGAIPDAILSCLTGHKDLGLHTEMFSDGAMDLLKKGVITNARKSYMPYKSVVTFLLGSEELYEYVRENPSVVLLPGEKVAHPMVIAQNDKMVAINSALQVDLYGQVNAETIGTLQYSGVGGQVDFVRGAALSKGGKSVIALPSTAANGTISRIVPYLDYGSVVTTSRCDVHYVATEYGVADLKGKSVRERAEALVSIAHPKFRDELAKAIP